MKKTINGKRYDTSKCEVLGEVDHRNNGNYAGSTRLLRASDGLLLLWCDSNGQDLYLNDYLCAFGGEHCNYTIDDFEMDDDQAARCEDLGLLKSVA